MSNHLRDNSGAPREGGGDSTLRIAGFPVHASPTVFLLFLLIAFTTATGLLPAAVEGASTGAYWTGGIVASALLLASLLAHELAHAIMARRHGIVVESVTFWLFGGLSRFKTAATSPRSEWRIAAVGPATNLVIAGASFGVGLAMAAASAPELAVAVAGYVASINVLLGVFNLLPAAPLDGGRILRAALWRRHGDRDRATITSAKAGQVIGALLVGGGFVELLAGSIIGGIWTGMIGFFLMSAARAEGQQTQVRGALDGLHVRDLLPPGEPLPAAPAWHTIDAFLETYRRTGDTRTVLPLQGFDGSPAGLVALAQLAVVPTDQRETVRLSAVAAPLDQVAVVEPEELLNDVLPRLRPKVSTVAAARLVGHALVLLDGRPVGVLTPADLARAVQLSKLVGRRPPAPSDPSPNGLAHADGAAPPRQLVP